MGTFLLNATPETRRLYRACTTAVAIVGAVFTVSVFVLLAANFIHSKVVWPVDSPMLNEMMEDLRAGEADPVTAERIRRVDFLTRRTYFFSEAFDARGFILLLGGLATTLLALQLGSALSRPLPEPDSPTIEERDLEAAGKARVVLGALSVMLLVAAVVLHQWFGGLPEFVGTPDQAGGAVDDVPAVTVPGVWPGLRGPGGIGIAKVSDAPLAWNGETGENVRWKTSLPLRGFSSPIVFQSRVFVTVGTRNQLSVLCLDAATGMLIKQTRIPSALPAAEWPDIPDETTYAAPTPAVAGQTVVALFGTGDIAGLNAQGELIWSRNLGVPGSMYGYASSLVGEGNRVFVQYDHDEDQRLIALDASTGATLWETERDVTPSWASPVVIDSNGKPQIVLCANPFVAGYDPEDGRELWRSDGLGGEPAPSAAYAGGMVYAASDFSVLLAIDLLFPGDPAWQALDNLPDVSSPLATDERLYIASSVGILTCFDRFDGTVLWTQEFDDGFYASPIWVDGKIYLTDVMGNTFVFNDAAVYEQLAVSPLGEACSATPAFIPGRIILRGQSNLFCIGTP